MCLIIPVLFCLGVHGFINKDTFSPEDIVFVVPPVYCILIILVTQTFLSSTTTRECFSSKRPHGIRLLFTVSQFLTYPILLHCSYSYSFCPLCYFGHSTQVCDSKFPLKMRECRLNQRCKDNEFQTSVVNNFCELYYVILSSNLLKDSQIFSSTILLQEVEIYFTFYS